MLPRIPEGQRSKDLGALKPRREKSGLNQALAPSVRGFYDSIAALHARGPIDLILVTFLATGMVTSGVGLIGLDRIESVTQKIGILFRFLCGAA